MAITFVGAGSVISGASVSAVAPACAASDLLVAAVGAHNAGVTITAPSGWTLAKAGTLGPGASFYTKIAASGDSGASFAFSSSSGQIAVAIVAYRGAAGVDASATSASTTSGSSITAPTVTTTKAGEQVVELFVTTSFSDPSGIYVSGPPATSRVASGPQSGTATPAIAVSDQAQATAGTSTAQTATLTGSGLTSAATTISLASTNVPPNSPPLNSPANNATIDRGIPQRFGWTFSDPNAGDSQSKFDLQYRLVGGSTWTTVSGATPNAFYDFPPSTFAAGNYEWQVRTYDAQGVVGPFSASSFFTAADAPAGPTITAPTNGATIGVQSFELDWSYPSQTAFQAQLLDGSGAVVTDLGITNSATTRAVSFGNIPNNVTRTAQVRVQSGGLWSSYSAVTVTVSYTPPTAPTFTMSADPTTATRTLAITNPAPGSGVPATAYNDVYVRTAAASTVVDTYRPYSATGTRIATALATNTPFVDRTTAGSPVVYEYRVVSVATNGTTTDSGWVSTP